MLTYNHLIGKQVFMVCNNKLIEVELASEVLTFTTATYQFKHQDKVHTEEIDIRSNFDKLFYYSVQDYTNGCHIHPIDYEFNHSRGQYVLVGDDSLNINAWVFENNRAIYKDVKVDSVVSYSKSVGERKFVTHEIISKTTFYKNADECYAFNKVNAANIDGNEIQTRTGYMLDMLAYTDEQKTAIEKLRIAIEEVNKTCTFMCSDDGLFVIAGKHRITDDEWACNYDDEYVGHIYRDKAIKLPHIERNYCDYPVLLP